MVGSASEPRPDSATNEEAPMSAIDRCRASVRSACHGQVGPSIGDGRPLVVMHVVYVALVTVRTLIGDSNRDALKNLEGRLVHWSAERPVAGFARDDQKWPSHTGKGPGGSQAQQELGPDPARRGPKSGCRLLRFGLCAVRVLFVGHVRLSFESSLASLTPKHYSCLRSGRGGGGYL